MQEQQILLLSPVSLIDGMLSGIPLNVENAIYAFEGKGEFETLNYSDIFIETANELKLGLEVIDEFEEKKENADVRKKFESILTNYTNPKYDNDPGIEKLRKYLKDALANDDFINKCAKRQLHAKKISEELKKNKNLEEEFKQKFQEKIKGEIAKYPNHLLLIPGSDPNIDFSGLDITQAKYWAVKAIKENHKNPFIAICGGLQAMLHNEHDTIFGTLGKVNPNETENGHVKQNEINEHNEKKKNEGHCPQVGMFHKPGDSPVKNTSAERCEHNQVVLAETKDPVLDENGRPKQDMVMLPAFSAEHKEHGPIFTNQGEFKSNEKGEIRKDGKGYIIVHYAFQFGENGKLEGIVIQHHIDVDHKKGPEAIKQFAKLIHNYKNMTFAQLTNEIQNVNNFLNTPEKQDVATQSNTEIIQIKNLASKIKLKRLSQNTMLILESTKTIIITKHVCKTSPCNNAITNVNNRIYKQPDKCDVATQSNTDKYVYNLALQFRQTQTAKTEKPSRFKQNGEAATNNKTSLQFNESFLNTLQPYNPQTQSKGESKRNGVSIFNHKNNCCTLS